MLIFSKHQSRAALVAGHSESMHQVQVVFYAPRRADRLFVRYSDISNTWEIIIIPVFLIVPHRDGYSLSRRGRSRPRSGRLGNSVGSGITGCRLRTIIRVLSARIRDDNAGNLLSGRRRNFYCSKVVLSPRSITNRQIVVPTLARVRQINLDAIARRRTAITVIAETEVTRRE